MFAPEAQTEILNTGPTPGDPATPLVELLSGDGALAGSGTSYELNLGSVEQYSNPLVAGYRVENDGIIPADLLSGSFLDAGSSQFLNSGLSPVAPIATGNADTAPEVELLTNQVGVFTENVTLTPTDSNLTNYSSIMPLVTIEVVGTITAPPPPPPVPEATAWGDVHLTTFDGVYYNFQAAGEYVLTRSNVAGDTFQVQARLEPYGANSSVTVETQVGAAIGSEDVVFALTGANYNASSLYLNGTAEALGIGQTLNLSGGSVTETSANTYRVNWATGESMAVTENGSYISDTIQLTSADAGKVQGLLGPDDGNPSTDLQLPTGQSIASGGTIASSVLYGAYESDWQVQSSPQSLVYYGTGQTFDGFNIPGFPEDALTLSQLPANLVAAAEAIVEAEGITNPNLVDAAVIDLLVTGDPNSVFSTANVQEEGVLLNSAAVSIPTPLPSVGILADSTTVLEPTSGTLAVDYTVYLTAAAAQTSTVDNSVTGSGPNNLGTADIVGGSGSGVVQIAAGQTSVQIVVDMLANALGSQPDAELQVSVTATGGESVFGGSAETEIVNPTPTAGNPAEALIEQLAGNGHLSGGGTDYVLNLGTQVQNGSDLYANLGIENGATVPANGLSGQFTIANFEHFLNTGFVPFSNVAPGAADTEPAIELGTGTIGVYTETIVLDPTDTNSSGYSQPQNDVTLTVTGTIVPMPLAPPPSMPTATAWGDVHLTTFDGLYYNLQAVGEFTLAKSTVANDNFNAQIRTTQYDGSSVHVIDQVAAGIGTDAVTFGTSTSQPATVLLNGGAANFVNGVLTLTDGTVTEESPSSYVVNWNSGESLTVSVAGSYINTTVALATQDEKGNVGVLRSGQSITGGSGTNTLELVGAGTFNLAAPTTLANIQVVDATEGPAGSEPFIDLRNGTALTLNLASAATNPQSAWAVVYGANNNDTINLGAGLDTVVIGGAGETLNGGSGNELFEVTATTIGATIAAGSGTNTMDVRGGGTVGMGASVTGIHAVFLQTAATSYDFTANATQGMVIHASPTNDTIMAGSASQTVAGSTRNLLVQATAANAGVYVRDGSGSNELDITTGGPAALNSGDNNLTVQLLAANTTLALNHMEFIHAEGAGGSDVIIAGTAGQVLTGGGTGDALEDAGHYRVSFQDTIAGIAGDTLADFSKVDTIELTNLSVGSVTGTPHYTGGYGASSTGTLAVTTGAGTIDIKLSGLAASGVFSAGTDGHGGTLISYS